MQTDNLELKKLVYLYLMNYAKSQPDMAIMAVNSFVKVTFPPGTQDQSLLSQVTFSEVFLDIVNVCIANKQPLFQKRASGEVLALTRNVHVFKPSLCQHLSSNSDHMESFQLAGLGVLARWKKKSR